MNVMLTRLPGGTVNAEPGDAVEVWITPGDDYPSGAWVPGFVVTVNLAPDWNYAIVRDADGTQWAAPLATVRHARGGAGHLRLQVARLRAFIDKEFGAMERFEELAEGDYKRGVNAMAHINRVAAENAIDDIDKYEYTEPEA